MMLENVGCRDMLSTGPLMGYTNEVRIGGVLCLIFVTRKLRGRGARWVIQPPGFRLRAP